MTFQEIILQLQKFWAEQGCILQQPYDIEKGAGTMNPATFLHAIGPEPWAVCYVEPSRRPADGRYGDNPNRLFQHHQFQVIVKPSPENIQELYLESLARLGIHAEDHDIRFVEEEGQSPIGHPNTAILDMSDGEKKAQLSGCSIGGGAIEVRDIVLHGINIKPAGSLPIVILVDFERKLNHERSLSDFLKLKAPFKEKRIYKSHACYIYEYDIQNYFKPALTQPH